MKKPLNPAISFMKQDADRVEAYLKEKGHTVPHSVILEALSHMDHCANWRTKRAQLQARFAPTPTFNMKGRSVRLYFSMHSKTALDDAPEFGYCLIDQEWMDNFNEHRRFQMRSQRDVLLGSDCGLLFLPIHSRPLEFNYISLASESFTVKGYAESEEWETCSKPIRLQSFLRDLQEAIDAPRDYLLYVDDIAKLDSVIADFIH